MEVSQNTVVTIEYTLKDTQGNIIDTSDESGPVSYIQGIGNMIPGVELALEKKCPGDSFSVSISPEMAYPEGEEALTVIPRSHLDADDLQIGMQFNAKTDAGTVYATIKKIEGENVTIASKHPLAGVTLNFDIKVIEVREATGDEISHGHVHTPNTHQH